MPCPGSVLALAQKLHNIRGDAPHVVASQDDQILRLARDVARNPHVVAERREDPFRGAGELVAELVWAPRP